MIRRSTLIVMVIFLLLLAVALLLPDQLAKLEQAPTAAPTQAELLGAQPADIARIRFSNLRGEVIEIAQQNGTWSVISPAEKTLSAGSMTEIATTLSQISVLNTLSAPPPDEATGLAQPDYTWQVVMIDGSGQSVKIGKQTATSSGYYAQAEGKPVMVLGSVSVERIIDLFGASNNPTATPLAETPTASPTAGGS